MTLNSASTVISVTDPDCYRVNEKVTQHFAWLFAHHAVQVHEYSEFHGSCRIVYLIDGVLLLQFITERGGVRWYVAPAGTDQHDAVDWVPPSDVVNFLTQQGPHYTDNMEYTLNTDRILGELSAELEPHMAQIVEFYRSAGHVVRREEFQQFRKTYDEEFMRQVNEYYARRRGSPPLTPG